MIQRDDQTLATPKATSRLDLWLRPHPALRLDLALEAEFDRFGADAEQAPLADLLLVSAGASWRLPASLTGWMDDQPGAGAELFFTAANLTDRQYRVFTEYPMPRLTYSAGVRVSR